MKSESKKKKSNLTPTACLSQIIETLAVKIVDEDKGEAKRISEIQRKLFGYVHLVTTFPQLKLVLTDEACLRLFHASAPRDILYFDATGSIIEKMHGFKKILLYTMTLRHPYGNCAPLPIAQYISSSHTTSSISSFIKNEGSSINYFIEAALYIQFETHTVIYNWIE